MTNLTEFNLYCKYFGNVCCKNTTRRMSIMCLTSNCLKPDMLNLTHNNLGSPRSWQEIWPGIELGMVFQNHALPASRLGSVSQKPNVPPIKGQGHVTGCPDKGRPGLGADTVLAIIRLVCVVVCFDSNTNWM